MGVNVWKLKDIDEDLKNQLMSEGFSEVVATLLVNREITSPEEGKKFLHPKIEDAYSPYMMLDLDKAVKRIRSAIKNEEKFLVYGHDDVDGIASAAVMVKALRALGAAVETYFPHRLYEEYKINKNVVQDCAKRGVSVILTVDSGITSYDEAIYAKNLGVKLIITDHHLVPAEIPPALAVVDPKRPCCPYPFDMLAGVGVAYKIAQVLLDAPKYQAVLNELLIFVAMGSISDKVPLIDENRILVKRGLEEFSKNESLSFQILKENSKIDGVVSEYRVKFDMVPLLTAGRETDGKHLGYDFLMCEHPEKCQELFDALLQKTRKQRAKSEKVIEDVLRKVEQLDLGREKLIILVDESIPVSMLGMCASHLFRKYNRPAIVIGYKSDFAVGEGRAPENFDLVEAFAHCEEYLIQYGGHKPAAGFSIKFRNVSSLTQKILDYANEKLDWDDITPAIETEFILTPKMINIDLAHQVMQFAPFGQKNPNPIFWVKNVNFSRTSSNGYFLNRIPVELGWRDIKIEPEDNFDILFYFDEKRNDEVFIRIEDIEKVE